MRALVNKSLENSDRYALRMVYRDSEGRLTARVVSPIAEVDSQSFMALCLCRQEPRRFLYSNCQLGRLVPAHVVFAPVEIVEIPNENGTKDASE